MWIINHTPESSLESQMGKRSKKWSEVKSLSRVRLFATPWTVAYQVPPSMGFSRQECWSGLPFPSPGDLPDPGIKPGSPALQADALPSEPPWKPKRSKKHFVNYQCKMQGTIIIHAWWGSFLYDPTTLGISLDLIMLQLSLFQSLWIIFKLLNCRGLFNIKI